MAEGKPVSEAALVGYEDLKAKLYEKNKGKELEEKIQERFAQIITDNFDKVDAESGRNTEKFILLFKDILTKEFPNAEIKIERDDKAYTFEVDGLIYVLVFPNSTI